ncbi:MAG: SDR family NAD(P)-dependent oxidoreductase, partial [Actinomycetes bacterium]
VLDGVFAQGPIDVAISAFGQLGNNDDPNDVDAVRRLLTVNYVASVTSGTIVAKHLKAQGYGSLVVLSSVAAERARLDNYVYASTKAGLDAWACGLADAMVGSGVQVLVVRPGFVDTVMTEGISPAPLATTAKVVAEVTVKGIRKGSSLVWAPATVRPLMSTMRHLPRPVFRVVAKKAGS